MKFFSRAASKVCLFLLLSIPLVSCRDKKAKSIVIKNSLYFERTEVISIPFSDFSSLLDGNSEEFKILNLERSKQYPYQLEKIGKENHQNVLILVTVPPHGEVQLIVEKGVPDSIPTRTFGRYVPERFDDFTWENDVIGFRMYGKALEGRPDDAQGMDVWAKRTNEMIIDKWYESKNYHKDYGDGLDYYSVGKTLGAGDVAPYYNDSLFYSKHYRGYEILGNGPIRTTFKLSFEPWKVGNRTVSLDKTISIDAGSQMNRIVLEYQLDGTNEITSVAGIAKRENGGEVIDMHEKGVFGYWEPEHGNDGIIGVGLIFNQSIDSITVHKNQFLSFFQVYPNSSLQYYAGAAWDKAGRIKSAADWSQYLINYQASLDHPLEINIQ